MRPGWGTARTTDRLPFCPPACSHACLHMRWPGRPRCTACAAVPGPDGTCRGTLNPRSLWRRLICFPEWPPTGAPAGAAPAASASTAPACTSGSSPAPSPTALTARGKLCCGASAPAAQGLAVLVGVLAPCPCGRAVLSTVRCAKHLALQRPCERHTVCVCPVTRPSGAPSDPPLLLCSPW